MNKLIGSKIRRLKWVIVFVAVFMLYGGMKISLAQEEGRVDLNALIQETQKISQKADEMTLVWWIPEEFWRISFTQDPTATEAQSEEFIKVLQPYTLIAVVDGKVGSFGGITYSSEADIRANINIRDSQGAYYLPFNEDEIGADVKNFLSMIKPIFVNTLGPLGQNMHFLLFPAKNRSGRNIAEAKKEGTFSVKLGEREFKWRLPLGSLLPPKICTKCGEKLSGAYKYCPYDGTPLKK